MDFNFSSISAWDDWSFQGNVGTGIPTYDGGYFDPTFLESDRSILNEAVQVSMTCGLNSTTSQLNSQSPQEEFYYATAQIKVEVDSEVDADSLSPPPEELCLPGVKKRKQNLARIVSLSSSVRGSNFAPIKIPQQRKLYNKPKASKSKATPLYLLDPNSQTNEVDRTRIKRAKNTKAFHDAQRRVICNSSELINLIFSKEKIRRDLLMDPNVCRLLVETYPHILQNQM